MASETSAREPVTATASVGAPAENRGWLWSLGIGLLVLAALAAIPFLGGSASVYFWTTIVLYVVLAQGWNFIGGFTGYAAFGNVAFFGTGAYTVAVVVEHHLPYWLGVILAVIVAALLAFLLSLPVLRLRGHYFAIATLGISVALGQVVAAESIGGTQGEVSLSFLIPTNMDVHTLANLVYYGFLALALVTMLFTAWLSRSRIGYALSAIRENELAAEALGIPTFWYKVAAFTLSAVPIAIAGAIYTFQNFELDPATVFDTNYSVAMVLMTFLGGAGTILGPIFGGIIVEYLDKTTTLTLTQGHGLLLGALIIVVTIFLPQGLLRLFQELVRSPAGVKQSYPKRVWEGVRRVTRFILSNGV